MKAKRRGNELNINDLERYGRTLLLDGVGWAKLVAGCRSLVRITRPRSASCRKQNERSDALDLLLRPRRRIDESTAVHSCLKATIGSTLVARRPGT